MPNEKYNIPFGIDPKDFFKELNNIDAGLDKLENKAVSSQKDMQAAFNSTASAGDKLAQTINNAQTKAGNLAEQAKKMGKELGDALSGKGVGEGLNGKIDAVRKKLQSVAETAIYVDVNFNDKKVDLLGQQIRAASTAAEEFNVILDFSKQQLAGLDKGSQSYATLSKQIEIAERFILQLNEAATSTVQTSRSLVDEFDLLFNNPDEFLSGKELKKLDAVVDGSANEVQRLTGIVGLLNEKLATLNPNTQEFKELQTVVTAGANALKGFEGEVKAVAVAEGQTETKTVALRTQMRAMREELARMELAGQGNTAEFRRLAMAAGELQDQIGDTAQRVKAFSSDTKYLDAGIGALTGLTGAFAATQGAMALFGDENERTQEVIAKVTGAMAILQGVQAVANTLNKDSAFSVIFLSRARVADTEAVVAETAATVALSTVQAGATETITAAQEVATTVTEGLTAVQETAATVTEGYATAQEVAATATGVATAAENGFTAAILKNTAALLLNPVTLVVIALIAAVAAMVLYSQANDEGAEAVDRLNLALDSNKNLLDDQIKNFERGANVATAYAKLRGASEADLTNITTQNLQKEVKARNEYAAQLDSHFKELEQQHTDGIVEEDDYNKEVERLNKERSANNQALYDLDNKIQVNGINAQTEANKKQEALRKKALADQKQHAEEVKKVNDQILKFAKEYASASIAAMAEGAEKDKALARAAAKDRIDQLNAEQALSVKAQDLRKKAITAINKQLVADIAKIDKDAADKRVELQLNANAQLAGLEKEGTLKDLDVLRAQHADKKNEIEKQFKDDASLRSALLNALDTQYNREVAKTIQEGNQKSRDMHEEGEVLTIELLTKYAVKNKDVEEQKQIEILKVQLKYAKQSLDAIADDGTEETALRKKRAAKVVKDLGDELDKATTTQKTKGLDWFKVLGLGDLTDAQKEAVEGAARQSLESISTITDFIVDNYQRQIDKKQELIDEYDKQIDDLEDSLDREKELQANGLANNVAVIEQELAAKKKAKEDELKQQEELQKKQAAAQRVQIALDTVSQGVNLATAATSIFKSLAGIPFIGIPLAIATIGLMTGAFIAAKAKAYAAVGDGATQKYKMGGWIKGKSHEGGGQKYGSLDGAGGVKELEAGEHVTNKEQAHKYADLLDAINSGSIDGMNEDVLKNMLEGMGISLSTDVQRRAVSEVGALDSVRMSSARSSGGDDLGGIRKDVAYLANEKRSSTKRWEDSKYEYEKTGDKLTKIRKR